MQLTYQHLTLSVPLCIKYLAQNQKLILSPIMQLGLKSTVSPCLSASYPSMSGYSNCRNTLMILQFDVLVMGRRRTEH